MSNEEWINKDVRVPEGSYLAASHETPGAERALLFDRESGNNLGPAEVRDPKPQPDGDDALRDAILIGVGAAMTLVAVTVPAIKRRLDAKVIPAVKAKWGAVFRTRKDESQAAATDDGSPKTAAGQHLTLVKDEDAGSAAPAA